MSDANESTVGQTADAVPPPPPRQGRFADAWRELKKDFADANSAALGVEFVATSISSRGDDFDINDRFRRLLRQDPHIKFFNSQRGYVRHVVTPERWQADFLVLDKVSVRDGRFSTRKSFVVESGRSALLDA